MGQLNQQVAILSAKQIDQKIKRIAHQILENFHKEAEIVLVGVAKKGTLLASRLTEELNAISEINTILCDIVIDKDQPLSKPCEITINPEELRGKVVILIDDVLNSGRTLIYACRYLLEFEPRKMKTAVLVDRRHRKFPIRADFVGLTLSTTLEEHISVDFEKNQVELI